MRALHWARVGLFAAALAAHASPAHAQRFWRDAREPARHDDDAQVAYAQSLLSQDEIAMMAQAPYAARVERLERASIVFATVLAREPERVDALVGEASALEWLGVLDQGPPPARGATLLMRLRAIASRTLRPDLFAASEALLQRALVVVGEGPALGEVLFRLGTVATRREHFAVARDAYARYVTLLLSEYERATGLGNLAESYASLGDLEHAVSTYRACVIAEPANAGGWWGLASAADRDGRTSEAEHAAQQALAIDGGLRAILGPGVFYTPEYDRFYYLGLAFEARAAETADPAERALQWASAREAWREFLRDGGAESPWAARARVHFERAEQLSNAVSAPDRSPARTPTRSRRATAPATTRPADARRP